MTDPASQGLRPPTGVPDVIEDYRKPQDARRRETLQLAHLRAEVLATAEGEAAALVSTTRAQISTLLVDARRKLLELAAQVQALPEAPDGTSPRDTAETRERILQARHDVRRGLEEALPDLESLNEAARPLRLNARFAPSEKVTKPELPTTYLDVETLEVEPAYAPKIAAESASPIDEPEPSRTVQQRWSSLPTWVGAFVVTGAIVLAGTFWWLRSDLSSQAPRTPPALSAGGEPNPTSASKALAAPVADDNAPADKRLASAPQPNDRPLTVSIDTVRAAWIRTTIDGRADGGRVFGAGEQKTIAADREIVLRVGDAGAVFVTQNGTRKPLGERGLVATRRFAIATAAVARPATTLSATDGIPTAVASAPVPAPAAGQPAEPASNAGPGLTATAERWLDAYYRNDAAAISSVATRGMKVSDERSVEDRLPAGFANVRRALDRVAFQVVGDRAILTARMVEEATVGGQHLQRVAWLSQTWIRETSQWRLADVHILGEAKLKQPAR